MLFFYFCFPGAGTLILIHICRFLISPVFKIIEKLWKQLSTEIIFYGIIVIYPK